MKVWILTTVMAMLPTVALAQLDGYTPGDCSSARSAIRGEWDRHWDDTASRRRSFESSMPALLRSGAAAIPADARERLRAFNERMQRRMRPTVRRLVGCIGRIRGANPRYVFSTEARFDAAMGERCRDLRAEWRRNGAAVRRETRAFMRREAPAVLRAVNASLGPSFGCRMPERTSEISDRPNISCEAAGGHYYSITIEINPMLATALDEVRRLGQWTEAMEFEATPPGIVLSVDERSTVGNGTTMVDPSRADATLIASSEHYSYARLDLLVEPTSSSAIAIAHTVEDSLSYGTGCTPRPASRRRVAVPSCDESYSAETTRFTSEGHDSFSTATRIGVTGGRYSRDSMPAVIHSSEEEARSDYLASHLMMIAPRCASAAERARFLDLYRAPTRHETPSETETTPASGDPASE